MTTVRLGVDLHRVVDEACDVLALDPSVYQRDGELVHVVRTAECEAAASVLAGTPQIRTLQSATLMETLTRHAAWERFDRAGEWLPPRRRERCLRRRRARQWRTVRPIAGVIESPSMRPGGSIIQRPGYDPPPASSLRRASVPARR